MTKEQITEMTGKLKLDNSEFEKWNEFPPEVKLECTKDLDFKTRWNLRNTSRIERDLVDSQKMRIERAALSFNFRGGQLNIKNNGKDQFYSCYTIENIILFFDFILKSGDFETLEIDINKTKRDEIDLYPKIYSLCSVKNLELSCDNDKNIDFWLNRVKDTVQSIKIHAFNGSDISVDRLFSTSKIINAHYLQITNIDHPDIAIKLAKIWIEKDVEMGREFQAVIQKTDNFEKQFSQFFANQISCKTPDTVRIRTINPRKHIILEIGVSTSGFLENDEVLFRMLMVPSESKENKTSGDWIQALELKYIQEDMDVYNEQGLNLYRDQRIAAYGYYDSDDSWD